MPQQRIQADTKLGSVGVRPVASPVDQFVQVNPNGGAAQLARALQEFAPSVRRLGLTVADTKAADSRQEGEQLASRLSLQKKTYDDAVKEGLIPRGANPFFYAGVKEQFGRVMAGTFSSDLRASIAQDENMRTTTNIGEYDAFVKDATQKWLDKNVPTNQRDEFFDAGFQGQAVSSVANLREQFAAELMGRVEKLGDEAFFAEASTRLSQMTPDTRANTVAGLQTLADDLIQHQGRNPTQVVRTLARAVAATATEHRSYAMLDVLKELKGKDGVLFATEYGKRFYADARKDIQDGIRQDRIEQRQQQEQEREDRTRGVLSQAVGMLSKNPQANLGKLISDNTDLPEVVGALNSLKNNIGSLTFDDDQVTVGNLTSRIWVPDGQPVTAREITAHVNHDLTAQTAAGLLNMLEARNRAERDDNENDPLHRALRDQGYLDEKATLRDRLAGVLSKNLSDGGQRLANAEAKLAVGWVNYLDNGGSKESWTDRRKWLNAEADRIAKSEEASLKVRVDPRDAAFNADGSSTNANSPGLKKPRMSENDAIRIGREIQSKSYTRATMAFQKQYQLDEAALTAEVKSALSYYHPVPGAK
jgi:hypothetical protein